MSKIYIQKNYQNNQPAAQAARVDDRQFEGANALRLSENYTIGPKAMTYLNEKFSHLKKQPGKFNFTGTRFHPHAYAAFSRKFMNRAIVCGCVPNKKIVDVGGHGMRTLVSERSVNGTIGKWVDTIHSMIPVLDAQDELRHENWKEMYAAFTPPQQFPHKNMCLNAATINGLCNCVDANNIRWTDDATYISIDSAYYEGVLDGIYHEMHRTGNSAYFAFHDYLKPYQNKLMKYLTFDDEAQVQFTVDNQDYLIVESNVKGNPFVYKHKVLNTNSRSWYKPVTVGGNTKYMVHQVIEQLDQGFHDYVLVKVYCLTRLPDLPLVDDIYYKVTQKCIQPALTGLLNQTWHFRDFVNLANGYDQVTGFSNQAVGYVCEIAKALLLRYNKKGLYKEHKQVEPLTRGDLKTNITLRHADDFDYISVTCNCDYGDDSKMETFTCRVDRLAMAYVQLLGSYETHVAMRVQKRLAQTMFEQNNNNIKYSECADAVSLALIMIADDSMRMYKTVHQDKLVVKARNAARGVFERTKNFWERILKPSIKLTIAKCWKMPLILLCFYCITHYLMSIGVSAHNGQTQQDTKMGVACIATFLFTAFMTLLFNVKEQIKMVSRIKLREKPKIIYGNCVTIADRLDLEKNKGRVDPFWKFSDPDWDIRGLSGEQAKIKLGCDHKGKESAIQIGPILRGTVDIQPIVKHSCKQTIMAAAIRACSNKIEPDPAIFTSWASHFYNTITLPFTNFVNEAGGIDVTFEEWLSKYPVDYRKNIEQVLLHPVTFTRRNATEVYESFPKIEFQVALFPVGDCDEPVNDLKERQISSPTDEKKIIANGLINKLEEIAHYHMPEYCGRKNWEEICHSIETLEKSLVDPIYGFSDGSGFDMTLITKFQRLFTQFIKDLFRRCQILLPYELRPEDVIRVFQQSERLRVRVGRGAASYETEGRASGDGWTTFGNTLLMISFWTYVFKHANIPKTAYFLLVKGDDVLFALERKYQNMLIQSIDTLMSKVNEHKQYGLGQVVKFVKWGDIVDGDFLSNMFFRTPNGLRMTRIPYRVFQTLGYSLKTSSKDKKYKQHSKELLFSKGNSLLAWARGLPIFEKLANKMIELGCEGTCVDYNKYADEGRIFTDRLGDYDAYLRWLEDRFHVTKDDVLELEEMIDSVSDQLDEIISPIIDKFYE